MLNSISLSQELQLKDLIAKVFKDNNIFFTGELLIKIISSKEITSHEIEFVSPEEEIDICESCKYCYEEID